MKRMSSKPVLVLVLLLLATRILETMVVETPGLVVGAGVALKHSPQLEHT